MPGQLTLKEGLHRGIDCKEEEEGNRPDSKAVSKVGYSKLILTFRIPNILSIILRLKLTSLK